MTEQEMAEAKVPTFGTLDELKGYIQSLVEQDHDYGTCVYAMSMAATAAFNHVARKLGATGFQAACADMDILRRTRGWKWGKILDYDNLLYPQYLNDEHFPTWQRLLAENRDALAKKANELIAKSPHAAHEVHAHWERLVSAAQPEGCLNS